MNQAANIFQSLRELAQFDEELRGLCKDTPEYQEVQDKIETLRAPLPTSILSHYDGRKARGKLAITPVRGGSVEHVTYRSLAVGRKIYVANSGSSTFLR